MKSACLYPQRKAQRSSPRKRPFTKPRSSKTCGQASVTSSAKGWPMSRHQSAAPQSVVGGGVTARIYSFRRRSRYRNTQAKNRIAHKAPESTPERLTLVIGRRVPDHRDALFCAKHPPLPQSKAEGIRKVRAAGKYPHRVALMVPTLGQIEATAFAPSPWRREKVPPIQDRHGAAPARE
jgi:hypothetical protein